MTDRRVDDRRAVDFKQLANTKQTVLTGGDVNYYLQLLRNGTVVELDDINLVLRISFFEGCSLKATHRLCKLRAGMGKPGSGPEYEAGKILYYNKLSHEESNLRALFGADGVDYEDINSYIVNVPRPKRLEPYSFKVGDYIESLDPSVVERAIFENLFTIAISRRFDASVSKTALQASARNIDAAAELIAQVKQGAYSQYL